MKRVIIESPYEDEIGGGSSLEYAITCVEDSLSRLEAPISQQLSYPLDRERGAKAVLEWLMLAETVVAYVDFGISPSMLHSLDLAKYLKIRVEYRKIILDAKRRSVHTEIVSN